MSGNVQGLSHEVFIALGSNLGNREEYLLRATEALEKLMTSPLKCSRVYETKPVGFVDQPDFLNLVVQSTTQLQPLQLLEQLHEIEQKLGRKRNIRFGPRTIDLDILLFGNRYECFHDLQIPHPRMWQRAFVMVPLAELAPGRRGLGGESVSVLAARIAKEGGLHNVGYLRQEITRIPEIEALDAGGTWRAVRS